MNPSGAHQLFKLCPDNNLGTAMPLNVRDEAPSWVLLQFRHVCRNHVMRWVVEVTDTWGTCFLRMWFYHDRKANKRTKQR